MGEVLVQRKFSDATQHPYKQVEWDQRNARIGSQDAPVFEQRGVIFPDFWSQRATDIVTQKYFRGNLGTPERESSIHQIIDRVVNRITMVGREKGYFTTDEDAGVFSDELTYILLHQKAAFNSPVWFNVGWKDPGDEQCSACFILSVDDSMESLMEWNAEEGMIFKNGSGAGVNLSKIRGSTERLSRGGIASGPVSFMRGADAWAGSIKSGGGSRKAAKLVCLDADHPDIFDFIWCKAREEEKALALRNAGFDMSMEGHGFLSIQYQNANNSVRLSDEFMQAYERQDDWHLVARSDKDEQSGERQIADVVKARDLMRQVAEAAWRCADPGVQFDTTINDWHTTPAHGCISSSNPCSEYMSNDDTACNLASINVMKLRQPDGYLDTDAFQHVVDVMIVAQEILCELSSYPTEKIATNARDLRQLGLGLVNVGAYLMVQGLPYDSDEARLEAAQIAALMTGRAYRASAVLAKDMGPYNGYEANKESHLAVIDKHGGAANALCHGPSDLSAAAVRAWQEAYQLGDEYGYRNAQLSVLAPTGTISFFMDSDTTGIEPGFSLVATKSLVGGGTIMIVNRVVQEALRNLGYTEAQIADIDTYVAEVDEDGRPRNSMVGAPHINEDDLPVFDMAVGERAIAPMGHVKMLGALQPFISGAISKTCNMPESTTVEEIENLYVEAWRLGVKAIAIYRDNSKTVQAMETSPRKQQTPEQQPQSARKRLPRERQSLTHKFCCVGDTLVAVADGRTAVSLEQLASEGDSVAVHAAQPLVVARTDGVVERGDGYGAVVSTMRAPRLTREQAEVVRVILDDGTYLRCTPDHPIMTADGGYRNAGKLRPGQSLAGFGRERTAHKVASVVLDGVADVYCGDVDEVHNFAVVTSGVHFNDFSGIIVHNCIAGHEGYITAGMYDDGTLGEIFLTDFGKEGSTIRGMMSAFATSVSIALQYGVPLETLVRKFCYMRFEPEGITENPEIRFAKSMPDYLMRWLASRFLGPEAWEEFGVRRVDDVIEDEPVKNKEPQSPSLEGPVCAVCGGIMQRAGSCYVCRTCGNDTGCG
jgi:ribonucleoside-diphosphate reductase alpha chain